MKEIRQKVQSIEGTYDKFYFSKMKNFYLQNTPGAWYVPYTDKGLVAPSYVMNPYESTNNRVEKVAKERNTHCTEEI